MTTALLIAIVLVGIAPAPMKVKEPRLLPALPPPPGAALIADADNFFDFLRRKKSLQNPAFDTAENRAETEKSAFEHWRLWHWMECYGLVDRDADYSDFYQIGRKLDPSVFAIPRKLSNGDYDDPKHATGRYNLNIQPKK